MEAINETIKAPTAKKNITKVGTKNSAIKKLTPTKNQIKYILIKCPYLVKKVEAQI